MICYLLYDTSDYVNNLKTTLKNGSSYTTAYSYDNLHQLQEAYNYGNTGLKINYTHDNRGNITKKETMLGQAKQSSATYEYEDHHMSCLTNYTLKDRGGLPLLTKSYDYEDSGDPTVITEFSSTEGSKTYNLTWEQSKLLKNITDGKSVTNAYCYNESSLASKVTKKDGSAINYHYDDEDQLEYEEYRNNSGALTKIHKYFYDSDGEVQFLLTKANNFTTANTYNLYAYVYNPLGDITDLVKLRSQSGSTTVKTNQHVAHYEYDPCGKILTVTNKTSENMGDLNPIRYKGYYYDNDLKWYQLESRFFFTIY